MKHRKLLAAATLGCALLCAGGLQAQALEEVDRAVAELGRFVLRFVPDRPGLTVTVLPFLSDRDGRVLLGDRLRGELEVYLAAELGQTRPTQEAGGQNTYTVSGELQVYPAVIRLLCRVYEPGGSLAGAARVDLPSAPELAALLVPPSGGLVSPSGDLRPTAPSPGTAGGRERPGTGLDAAQQDPFEPDDQPGFEVEVPPEAAGIPPYTYARYLAPGDIDRFRFYKSREGPAALEVRTGVDLQLLLYREGENLPFEVASGRSGDSLRLERALVEGYYIVELLAFAVNIQGQYSLSLSLSGAADDSFEPDNVPEQATVLAPNTRQQRVLLPGDTDWVELAADVPGFYTLYTTGEVLDTTITLFAENNRELLSDDNSGEGVNAFVALFLGVRRTYARISAADPRPAAGPRPAADPRPGAGPRPAAGPRPGAGPRQSGPYGLSFERVEPRQLYPDAGLQTLQLGSNPETLQLRVFQSGRYLVAARGVGRPSPAGPIVQVFSLPSMRLLKPLDTEGLHNLAASDYLLVVTGDQTGMLRLCVASESQAAVCRQRLAE